MRLRGTPERLIRASDGSRATKGHNFFLQPLLTLKNFDRYGKTYGLHACRCV